jgi:hypothetical protein
MMRGPGGGHGRGGFGGPGRMAAAGPPKSAKDLWGALRQLVARLRPERWRIAAAALIGSTGVGLLVAAPRICSSTASSGKHSRRG